MDRDNLMRRALHATSIMNVGGAMLFAFPDSVGRFAGLPGPVPRLHSLFLAGLVLMFAGTYAWLARQPRIDRPLVAFSALGKTLFVAVVTLCWLLGDVPFLSVAAASADLVFAAIFVWWLLAPVDATAPG